MEEYKKENWMELVQRVEAAGVDAIEINFSCPHGMPGEEGGGNFLFLKKKKEEGGGRGKKQEQKSRSKKQEARSKSVGVF